MQKGNQKKNKNKEENEKIKEKDESKMEIDKEIKENLKEIKEKKKKVTKRVVLNEQNLLYGEEGIRKLYNVMINQEFNSAKEVINNFFKIYFIYFIKEK